METSEKLGKTRYRGRATGRNRPRAGGNAVKTIAARFFVFFSLPPEATVSLPSLTARLDRSGSFRWTSKKPKKKPKKWKGETLVRKKNTHQPNPWNVKGISLLFLAALFVSRSSPNDEKKTQSSHHIWKSFSREINQRQCAALLSLLASSYRVLPGFSRRVGRFFIFVGTAAPAPPPIRSGRHVPKHFTMMSFWKLIEHWWQ